MIRLIKIELHKALYNRTFWILLGLHFLLLVPAIFAVDNLLEKISFGEGTGDMIKDVVLQGFSVFNYPNIWHNVSYLFFFFQFLLAIIVVSLVSNEYTLKTLRQNIIDGMSKWEIIWAKELMIVLLGLVSVAVLFVLVLILGKSVEGVGIMDGTCFVVAYFVTLMVYLNFAYFLTSWLKKSGLVIGILFLYSLIEAILSARLPDEVAQFLPMNVMRSMIPNPFGELLGQNAACNLSLFSIGLCVFYTAIFIGLNYWMLKRGHAAK